MNELEIHRHGKGLISSDRSKLIHLVSPAKFRFDKNPLAGGLNRSELVLQVIGR